MNERFVPLTATTLPAHAQAPAPAHAKIAHEGAPKARPFVALATVASGASEPGPVGPVKLPVPAEPVLTLHRDGDQIKQILIQCTCGQIIELVCHY